MTRAGQGSPFNARPHPSVQKHFEAADSSGLCRRVARMVTVGQRQAACSAWPPAGTPGGALVCNPGA